VFDLEVNGKLLLRRGRWLLLASSQVTGMSEFSSRSVA